MDENYENHGYKMGDKVCIFRENLRPYFDMDANYSSKVDAITLMETNKEPVEIVAVNSRGNVVVKTKDDFYFRLFYGDYYPVFKFKEGQFVEFKKNERIDLEGKARAHQNEVLKVVKAEGYCNGNIYKLLTISFETFYAREEKLKRSSYKWR